VGAQILYSSRLGRSGTQVVSGYSVSDAQHWWVEPGDELAILFGYSVPVVLSHCKNHYHLRSDCFVQVWMKGEMLDAPGKTDEEIIEDIVTGIQIC
jgi:hypothetical protein